MKRLKSHPWWIVIALMSLLAVACSPFGDDTTPAQQVATPIPTATGTATTAVTAISTATASPSPTATPEPYPGITMPVPSDGCDVTPMTGWRVDEGIQATWFEGDGVAVGVPGGLLYEGENRLLWRGDGEIQFSAVPTDGSSPETRATSVTGIDVEGHATTAYMTFEAPGCWQIGVEQGGSRLDATVAVHPADCRPESFDLAGCPDPPYALYSNPAESVPVGCDVTTVVSLMTGFFDAINRGDVEAALAFFPDREQDTDSDTKGLQWYSLEKMVADNPAELRSLFASLIEAGEQLRLLQLGVFWDWHGGATFHVVLTRETDTLVRYRMEGKGAANCELGDLFLFSVGRQP